MSSQGVTETRVDVVHRAQVVMKSRLTEKRRSGDQGQDIFRARCGDAGCVVADGGAGTFIQVHPASTYAQSALTDVSKPKPGPDFQIVMEIRNCVDSVKIPRGIPELEMASNGNVLQMRLEQDKAGSADEMAAFRFATAARSTIFRTLRPAILRRYGRLG